jgi:RecA-family ATPase
MRAMAFRTLSRFTPEAVSWLSPGRLALGKLAILDGNPDMGKSFLTLDLCARVSTGRPLWDGPAQEARAPADVAMLSSEDSHADTILPRLQALGADLSRVHSWIWAPGDAVFRLPHCVNTLEEIVRSTDAKLVLIDPIVAFLDRSIQLFNDQSVRQALEPLHQLAEGRRCAVVMVRHLNKTSGGETIYRGGGSIGFLAACRIAYLAAKDPTDPAKRVLAQVKNNIAPLQSSLAYQIVNQEGAGPVLRWLGVCSWTADQVVASSRPLLSAVDRACDFLLNALTAAPRTVRELWEEAQKHKLSRISLDRAREKLCISTDRGWIGKDFVSYWCLSGQTSPLETADPDCADFDDFLRRYRKQYPPPTPLEEG